MELVDKFCYLGDMLSLDGDPDAAVEARIRIGWNKFWQLVPLLTNMDMLLIMKVTEYANQATRYASQHIWCLSQARINWEGCASAITSPQCAHNNTTHVQYETRIHKINTDKQINLCTVKWALCDKTQSGEL